MPPATVLIVTRKFDPHADRVIEHLRRRNTAFFRLNTDHFHTEYRIAASGADGAILIEDKWGRAHRFPSETHSVWYRKPIDPAPPAAVTDPEARRVILDETLECLSFLGGEPNVLWVNNPEANAAARRKLPQLRRAAALGLRVPRTLVTNDPDRARAFRDETGGALLCKPMKANGYEDGPDFHALFARKVTAAEFEAQVEQIALCPTLFQEYIEKDHELRITVIGEAVFCCRIDSQAAEGAETDWRRVDPFRVPHEIVPLPSRVETALRTMLHQYDLRFGAFDAIVTPAGEYVFLELNPNGQWLWIELIAGAPMAAAMADLLAP